jgi:3alpha(or 20beta)-hydroxysteroid dehydrogenase
MTDRVLGKRFIVTGGACGLGASHVRHLAEEGAAVVIGDVLSAEGMELADELQADGLDVQYTHLDVISEASWRVAIDGTVNRLGGIDGLVNNVGTPEGSYAEGPIWDAAGIIHLGIGVIVPYLRAAGGGSVVNLSPLLGFPGEDAFAQSEAEDSLRLMTRSAALTYAPDRIRVNSVCLGMVHTAMDDAEADRDRYVATIPVRRMAEPVDVSKAVLFLLSDDADFITGSDLVVDGCCPVR